jgi:hypothetical protein
MRPTRFRSLADRGERRMPGRPCTGAKFCLATMRFRVVLVKYSIVKFKFLAGGEASLSFIRYSMTRLDAA